MDMRVVTGIILLGLIVLVGISLWGYQRRRTARLRSRFGSEYERTVQDRAGRARAEAELEARVQRVKTLTHPRSRVQGAGEAGPGVAVCPDAIRGRTTGLGSGGGSPGGR